MTVPLLTPHFSHLTYHITTSYHNSSQLITSQLITAPLLTPLLTSLITSELITAPLLTPDITRPLLTPHFSHLPEVYINLRYIKA